MEAAQSHIVQARSVLGAVYNENLTRYDWHAPDPDEQTCNQTVHVKLEQEVERLQETVERLQAQMAVADLDEGELHDLQETVMDVDDEIEIAGNVDGDNEPTVRQKDNSIEEIDSSLRYDSDSYSELSNVNGDNFENPQPSTSGVSSLAINANSSTLTSLSHGTTAQPINNESSLAADNIDSFVSGSHSTSMSQLSSGPMQSIFDIVAGYINFNLDVSVIFF